MSFTLTILFVVSAVAFNFENCIAQQSSNRVEFIFRQMSLRDKVDFIGGYKDFNIRPFQKYGIPEIKMADGPVGIRNNGPSTDFPASIALAASWDTELARKVGQAIGMEAKSKNIQVVFGPGLNIYRAAFCGRNFEYLGEDPYLAGQIAASYVLGMQSEGVVATAKHYAANYMEYNKHNVSSDMDERTLREIYLPAFEECVKKANVGAVMTAYNLVNGEHCSQNKFLNNQILKKEWGFSGMLISDWGSTYDGLAAAKSGLDLEMPSGQCMSSNVILPAIADGRLSEAVIDDKVRRILTLYERFHFFDNPDISKSFILDKSYTKEVGLDAARGGITLLKNKDNLLPLNGNAPLKIAIIGPNADPAVTGGGGSSYITPQNPVSLLKAFQNLGSSNLDLQYARGLYDETDLPRNYFKGKSFYTYADGKKMTGITAEVFDDTECKGKLISKQIVNDINVNFSDNSFAGLPKTNFCIRFTYYVKVGVQAEYKFAVAGDDSYRLKVNDNMVINKWENIPKTVRVAMVPLNSNSENKVVLEYFQKERGNPMRCSYSSECDELEQRQASLNQALRLARKSDVVIISAGFNQETEGEGMDRAFEMPGTQDQLIDKLAAANSNCVVVVNAGGNVRMNWLDNVAGLIYAWYPGESGNTAVAEIIFGRINPSGKLPVSFEKKWSDSPVLHSYFDPHNSLHVNFSEGVFIGYRYYDQSSVKPLFPFGFGLSFTTFSYSNLRLSKQRIRPDEGVEVNFELTNTGQRDGAEVSQVYVSENTSELPRPIKELKGFSKTFLRYGAKKLVTINLDKGAFSYFNPQKGGWITEPGRFFILVASSSQKIELQQEITISE